MSKISTAVLVELHTNMAQTQKPTDTGKVWRWNVIFVKKREIASNYLVKDIELMEKVQKRMTKMLPDLKNMSYPRYSRY